MVVLVITGNKTEKSEFWTKPLVVRGMCVAVGYNFPQWLCMASGHRFFCDVAENV